MNLQTPRRFRLQPVRGRHTTSRPKAAHNGTQALRDYAAPEGTVLSGSCAPRRRRHRHCGALALKGNGTRRLIRAGPSDSCPRKGRIPRLDAGGSSQEESRSTSVPREGAGERNLTCRVGVRTRCAAGWPSRLGTLEPPVRLLAIFTLFDWPSELTSYSRRPTAPACGAGRARLS